jgi:diguanylate cyclase (GGDEF)-like protein
MLAGIYHDVAHVWTTNEVELLRGVASQVEMAIDQSELYKQTHYQSLHDRLTGLPNRMLLDDRLVQAIAEAHRHQRRMAVMFMDVDRFKVINDTLGHACGDLLLQEIALRVVNCLRDVDTVARWGGDEFVILLPQIQKPSDGVMVAQRILTALKPIFEIEDHALHISSSIGIASYPEDGKDAETLLKNADAALYQAKAKGRNTYDCYTPTIKAPSSDVLTIETSLYQALENQELILHYQPQVNIETWEITGVEALVRWQHPELGLVSPGVFIPIAEANGLIVPIGEWVLRTACAQAIVWQAKMPSLKIAVNLSARQFQQPNLVGLVANVLSETGLPSSSLELEITESTVMHDVTFARSTLTAFQAMGIHLSMDDFGTGYSSLSYLKQYPLHTIKIDRSFIQELPHDPYDQAIVTAVVAIGKSLSLRVVAEGVETQEQLNCLKHLGCNIIQGYFFSRPLPVQGITDLLIETQLINQEMVSMKKRL